jgi:hypothetical protein
VKKKLTISKDESRSLWDDLTNDTLYSPSLRNLEGDEDILANKGFSHVVDDGEKRWKMKGMKESGEVSEAGNLRNRKLGR